jgi:dethiobiotin synthetase
LGGAVFVTGTGTDVGKTYVTALMVRELARHGKRPGYYKAAMSGNVRREDGSLIPGDALWVQTISGIAQPLEEMCPYVYEHAWSPHLAARAEGNPVELDVVKRGFQAVCGRYDYVTVEGSGGILCPLRFDEQKLWLEDVVRALGLPCVLVADAGLGTINSVALTAEYMNERGLPVKGVIFNHFHPGDLMEEDNLLMCRERTGLPVLAKVEDGDTELDMDIEALTALYE